MSVVTGNKGEKGTKKFQSLNINNLYQGSALKPLQKSIPQKHGLQSLGKVPTARRAPANLPSLKAEHSGNDPTINLVPSGHGVSGGWTAGNKEENEPQRNVNNKPEIGHTNSSASPNNSIQPSLSSKSTWGGTSSATSKPTTGTPHQTGSFLNQRSPLFGQDFPSLDGSSPSSAAEPRDPSPPPSNKSDSKYGPGPSLRPQNFPSWSFSGKQSSPQNNSTQDQKELNDKGNNLAFEGNRNRPLPDSGSLKFDVGVNSPLLQQSGTPNFSGGRKTTPQRSQAVLVNKPTHQPSSSRPRENLFQGSIIDNEKLKRMDDIDSTDDDWTRKDESFDYNKKIDSDEEEDYSPIERSHGNWTDQVTISSTSSRHSEPRDNFDGPVQQYVGSSGNRNIKVKPTSHDNLSFLDDEDQRRTKKNEEVLKNIERARRRRAEEEQKYRVVDDFGGRRSPSQYNDYHSGSSGKRSNDVRRPSPGSYENGVSKSVPNNASFGKFDVGGQTESDDYDSEPKRNDHSLAVHGGNRGNKQNSVPPRFKRQGGGGGDQLHSYKRSSPPKDRNQHFSGDADISADVRSSASRESAESQSQDKDYGGMFRQQSSNSGGGMPSSSGWGMRSHQHEGSSDRDDVASRFDEGSASEQRPSSQEESKRLNHATINENDDEVGGGAGSGGGGNFARGSGGRTSNRSGKGRSDKHDDTKHKASNKTSDSTKERNQGKRDSNIQNKSDRGQRNNQRGGGHNNASGRNNDGKKSNDQKGQSSSRNQRSGSNKKDDEFEDNKFSQRQLSSSSARQDLVEDDGMSTQPASAPAKESNETFENQVGETPDNSGGWFAPRGQPSRRGRGGLASGTGGRQSNHRSGNAHDNELDDHHSKHNKAANRRSQQLNDDWDESSSERSAGQNEDHRRDGNRRGGGGGGDNRSHGGRKDRSKKQGKSSGNDHGDDKRGGANKHDNEDIEAAASNRNKRGDRNNRGDRKHDDKDIKRSGGSGGQSDRRNNDRDSKQIAFERRQNKLPPRLAKQKEQNRQSGGQIQPQSVTEAWGSQNNDMEGNASNNMPPPVGGGVQWDPSVINQTYGLAGLQHQPQQQQSQSSLSVGMDFENNRALLIQRLRSGEDGVMSIGADSGMRLDATGLAVGSGASNVGLASNMTEAFTPESRENAVQTIIFENTNFKGPRPMVGNAGPAGENEKMMFKLGGGGQDKSLVGGFNQSAKGEDDLKLDFTFETADIPGSGEVGKDGQGSGGVSAHRPVSSSSVATAVVSSSQPATADDLNMKIASVKKVWETLPSMSPVPGGGVGGEQPSTIGPFSANEDKAFDPPSNGYDKDTATTAAANMAKMRPNQQNNQVPSHHPPNSQAAHGQQQVQNQPIPHSVHSQLQQPSNQLHHQSLLQPQQQASLDDRVLGRGNGANMAYNRLLGTGALPNLQSPPSILGQQPSLYQAFQIDPNRGVTNQLYPYAAATGIGGQSLILPPSGSSLSAAGSSATNTADLFGTSSNSQFRNQFAAPPPSGTQTSTVMSGLMSQSSLMTSSMKPATANIGPIGTKAGQLGGHNAYQQGGIGSLPATATSPLIIPYDGSFVPRSGQTAFYQALASQQTSRQNNFGITGFPNQQSLIQQQMMRNQVPPQIPPTYMKPDSGKQGGNNQQRSSDPYNGNNVGLGGLQGRQFNSGSTGQHQQPAIKATATSLASMSLRGSVLGTNANTNGTVSTSAQAAQQTASYSPTPIRPPGGKGKSSMNADKTDEASNVAVDVAAGIKDKKEDN